MQIQFTASNLKKVFNRRVIFQNISFSVQQKQTLLVTGRNGSGKSTLVKILSDVLSPTEGSVSISPIGSEKNFQRTSTIGLVSPYLQMYDEFSAEENLQYALAIRGMRTESSFIQSLLKKVFLYERRNDAVRTYSSGMKQRMKYAFALVHNPSILILDEPTSNLDAEGIAMVKEIMHEHREKGILIVATNDLSDVDRFEVQVDLNVTK